MRSNFGIFRNSAYSLESFRRAGGLGLHCYFLGDTTPAGRVVQKAVNGVVKEQKQPVAQAWVALQLPPQVVAFWAGFRNYKCLISKKREVWLLT